MTAMPARPSIPLYALLREPQRLLDRSQHQTPIKLDASHPRAARGDLTLNGKVSRSNNPQRFQQHGFHFNADNCIGCHACESACSEKNNLPPHLAFRKVGFLEGGSYPDTVRLNISMACNHCEDPVCLKACPTRAYTKYAEYGAVLQDPDICFGCGYCTWVCPYNAPQLDPVNGQVEKCNMCVDRLEQGLKPACVAACLGNALEFGVIEDLPRGREQAKLTLPGFPDPTISRPNIRFQQTRALPQEFSRADGAPIRYRRNSQYVNDYQAKPQHASTPRGWGLNKLSSRENPLVAFTLLSQGVVGAFLCLYALFVWPGTNSEAIGAFVHGPVGAAVLIALPLLLALALALSATHLGKTRYFYRGFNNLRHSWLSREAAALAGFFGALCLFALTVGLPALAARLPGLTATLIGGAAATLGLAAIYCMARIYRIKARPFWNHWHTNAAFFASVVVLGALGLAAAVAVAGMANGSELGAALPLLGGVALAGFGLQAVALGAHRAYLRARGAEADVSRVQMLTTYGYTHSARWLSLALISTGIVLLLTRPLSGGWEAAAWVIVFTAAVVHEAVGRALFYVLVTPTTMPGAFFWNNKYFETHARRTGLAALPQVGVAPDSH